MPAKKSDARRRLALTIAGCTAAFLVPVSFHRTLARRYAAFLSSRRPVICVHVSFRPEKGLPRLNRRPLVGHTAGVLTIRRSDFEFHGKCGAAQATLMIQENIYSFDALLRVLYASLLAERNGVLVHAAGLLNNRGGLLFAGPSGAGKSTLTRLCTPRFTALSDEVVALTAGRKGYTLHGTPFWGKLAGCGLNRQAPLRSAFFLSKGLKCRTLPLTRPEAVQRLLRCILCFDNEKNAVRKVFQWAVQWAGVTCPRILVFPKSRVLAEQLQTISQG